MTNSEINFFRAKGFVSGCERVRFRVRKGSFGSAKGALLPEKGEKNGFLTCFFAFLNEIHRLSIHRMVEKV